MEDRNYRTANSNIAALGYVREYHVDVGMVFSLLPLLTQFIAASAGGCGGKSGAVFFSFFFFLFFSSFCLLSILFPSLLYFTLLSFLLFIYLVVCLSFRFLYL